jgi:hypothetical protein
VGLPCDFWVGSKPGGKEFINEIESAAPMTRSVSIMGLGRFGGWIRHEWSPFQPGNAADVVSARTKMLMLTVYGLLTALRYPWLLLHGRLWAEEGSVYLRSGWTESYSSALFASHLGYYALWPNAVGLIAARWVPLPFAALLMTWCAFLIQLLAGYCLVQCEAFASARIKALALAVLLITAPSYEVWLNTINSQSYLVLCAAVILISRPGRHWIQRNSVLVFATLTGPLTMILSPFFLLRAFLKKTRAAYLQAGLVTLFAAIQVSVVVYSLNSGARRITFDPALAFPKFLVRFVALPFGSRLADMWGTTVVTHPDRVILTHPVIGSAISMLMAHHLLMLTWALADLFFVGGLIWVVSDRLDRTSLWLVAVSLWLGAFSIYGSYNGDRLIGERYVFPSTVLIGLSLTLAATRAHTFGRKKIAARILLTCFLLAGSFDYLTYSLIWVPAVKPAGPDWYSQAQSREHDENQELSVWPRGFPDEHVSLPRNHR